MRPKYLKAQLWEQLASMPTVTWGRSVGILEENGPLGSELVPLGSETEVLRHVLVPEKYSACLNISVSTVSWKTSRDTFWKYKLLVYGLSVQALHLWTHI